MSESLDKVINKARKTKDDPASRRAQRIIDAMDRLLGSKSKSILSLEEENLLFAETLEVFIKDSKGNPLEMVTIKGSGSGYYYSMSDKRPILVPRDGEYYLVSEKPDDLGRLKVYSHYKFTSGVVLLIPKDEIDRIGWN